MWPADSPTSTTQQVAKACAQGMKDQTLKAALLASVEELVTNSNTYRANARAGELAVAKAVDYPVADISDTQMLWLYERRFAKARTPGRKIYEELLGSSGGLCCYCQYSRATTLDHFLPKSAFSTLSIEPWNLVPCCPDCNLRLGSAQSQMLHPYFMPDLGRWLHATVEHTTPVTVRFYAEPDSALDSELSDRLRAQFERLRLADLYAVVSGNELSGLGRRLPTQFSDSAHVRAHLLEVSATAFAADMNDRRGAMYEALGQDSWYCEGGYAL